MTEVGSEAEISQLVEKDLGSSLTETDLSMDKHSGRKYQERKLQRMR